MELYDNMIDTSYRECETGSASRNGEILHEYVQALLARQQAMDLLESIQLQIKDVWAVIRQLLDYTGGAARASKAVRVARAAKAAQAQSSYRYLEKRRQECIADLQAAELRSSAALRAMTSAPASSALRDETAPALPSSRNRSGKSKRRPIRRPNGEQSFTPILKLPTGMTDAFIGN